MYLRFFACQFDSFKGQERQCNINFSQFQLQVTAPDDGKKWDERRWRKQGSKLKTVTAI
jgi:hypothetical protein